MAGQRCSSSEFQGFSVPAAEAAVRAWAASASQQFSVSGFERCRCPGVSACPALASQQFRVPEFQRLSVPAAAAAGRGWAALQQFSVSEFKRLSVAAAAAAGRGWAALQQFRVSGLQRSRCGGRGACLGSVSVAAVQCFSGLAFRLRRRRCVAGQRYSSSEFQGFSVPAAAAAVRAWAASASQQFSVSAVKRSGCGGGGAWQGSVTAVQSFRVSAVKRSGCGGGGAWLGSVAAVQSFSV